MVFVTGATGLIGSFLLLELSRRGKRISAMKRPGTSVDAVRKLFAEFSEEENFEKIKWVEGDLLDVPKLPEILEGADTVYHTAASVGFDDRSSKLIHSVNVMGTENLVNEAISRKIPNFIYISSVAVLDGLPGEKIIDENSAWDPEKAHSEYAISKKKGEMAVWRGSQEGLNVLVAYPSVVIGSLDGKRASEKLFELSARNKTFASEGLTGYVDVRDVAFCLAELAGQNRWNQGFIITSEDKSFIEVFNFLRRKWNLPPAKSLSESKLKFIRTLSWFSRIFGGPYMSKASYGALTGKSGYSNKKIGEAIGLQFIPVETALEFHGKRWKKLKS